MQREHFISLSIFQIMAMFRRGIFYFFLSIYLKEYLGVSNTEMTLFATLPMLANISAQSLIWGRISDKFQKRRLLIIIGELFAAIGYLVVFFLHKNIGINVSLRAAAYTIIIGFAVIEAGWSSSNLGWAALIADLTTEQERSKIMGRFQFIGGIGNILGVTASGFLYKGGEGFWNGNLFFISSGIMVFSIFALFLIPESYAELEKENNEIEEIKELSKFQKPPQATHPLSEEKKTKTWNWHLFVWILVILAIVNIGGNSINQMLQIYIRLPTTFNASDQIVAQLRNVSSAAMIIGGLVIGLFTKRFGDSKMLFVSFILVFIGTISLPIAPNIIIIFIYMALKGISRVWISTTSYAMVTKIVPLEKRGRMMGYYNAVFFLAWGLGGTVLTGPVADAIVASNVIILGIYTGLALVILGLWCFLFISYFANFIKKSKGFCISTVLFLALLITASIYFSNSIAELIVQSGNSDAYAYTFTFYIATTLVGIGTVSYIFLRPENYRLFVRENKPSKRERN